MKKYLLVVLASFLLFSRPAQAKDTNRYVNIVNPVRGRELWQSLDSVKRQINLITEYKIPSTWLLSYDVITDDDSLGLFNATPENQEIGVLLEVSEKLSNDASVPYLFGDGDRARADKVLLSGYTPPDRKRMLDQIFAKFKEKFGFYPASVGAWYIDTLSLDYLVEKYHVRAVMDVADQYQTDRYGLWGKPWGTPYYPSKFNSLLPAKDVSSQLNVVKIQWAPRDPVKGYGRTAADSVFSVQANDYGGIKLDNSYFQKLARAYLFSPNLLNQLTVGIEAGQEGASYFDEYKKQLLFLDSLAAEGSITFLTMSSFASEYKRIYPHTSGDFFVAGSDLSDITKTAYWYSTPNYRIGFTKKDNNLILRDLRLYPSIYIYKDIFSKDESHDLKRFVPSVVDGVLDRNEKVLIINIKNIQADRSGESIILSVTDANNAKHKVILTQDAVSVDDRQLFAVGSENNLVQTTIAGLLVKYWLNCPHFWTGSWRYSFINGKFYFGLMFAPDKLIGVVSSFPFIGIFDIPFQVLTRFRTFPQINIASFISGNLVNILNNSIPIVFDFAKLKLDISRRSSIYSIAFLNAIGIQSEWRVFYDFSRRTHLQ